MKKTRPILILTHSPVGGGAEMAMKNLASLLCKNGTEVVRISMLDLGLAREVSDQVIFIKRTRNPIKLLSGFLRFYKALREENPRLIVVNCEFAEFMYAFFAPKSRALVIEHLTTPWSNRPYLGRLVRRILDKRKVRWVYISKSIRQEVSRRGPVIHNLYNFSTLNNIPELVTTSKSKLFFVGRLVKQKNPQSAVRIAGMAKMPLLVYGKGEELSNCIALARDVNAEVRFLGYDTNPWLQAKKGDFLLMFSRYEGNPMVIKEALFCGVKVICAKHLQLSDDYINYPIHIVDSEEEAVKILITESQESSKVSDLEKVREKLQSENNLVGEKWLQIIEDASEFSC